MLRTIILLLAIFSISYSQQFIKVDKLPKDELLCIKKKPSITAGTIATLAYSTKCVEVIKHINLDNNNSWFQVRYNSKLGWIDGNKTSQDNNCSYKLNSPSQNRIIEIAKSKLGLPYSYAKSGPDSFDCSGFVYYVYKRVNKTVPRTSLMQSRAGKKLKREELEIGDIVLFDTMQKGHINHSGIYIGDGKFVHATSGKAYSVTTSNLDSGFYKDKFRWGVRVENKRGKK